MIILVDMDDTIEHLLKAWVNGVNEKYGRCVSCDEIVSWDICELKSFSVRRVCLVQEA